MRKLLGRVSRYANSKIPGALEGESLCGRLGRVRGPKCFLCRLVGWLIDEPEHCQNEMDWARRK